MAQVQEFLQSAQEIDCLTFSGNGEPTLHPDFVRMVSALQRVLREQRPEVRLALLTNSVRSGDEQLAVAYRQIQLPIFKLDAGRPEEFVRLNRPCPGIRFDDIITGLIQRAREQPIILQTVMIQGEYGNATGTAFEAWLAAVRSIGPEAIQLYTTDRPVADTGIVKLPAEQLQALAVQTTARTGIPAQAYY